MNGKKIVALVALIIFIDQALKFYIKLNYFIGEEHAIIGTWARLHFVENEGMAWGTKIPGEYGKLILTVFRLFAVAGIGYWLWDSIKKQGPKLLNLARALIFAGALGNIIDSVFYGVIFTDSYNTVAKLFPEGGGYAPLFYGHVVDMLQFPLVEWTWPKWIPVVGGDTFLFFQYIFNVADTAISSGVGIMIVFNKKIFKKETPKMNESFED